MAPAPTRWAVNVRLSTPGLCWESRGSWQDSPKIRELLLALDGTLGLNVREEGKEQPNDIRIAGNELVPEGERAVLNVLCQARELERLSDSSLLSSCDKLNHPRRRSVRSVQFGQVSMDLCMPNLTPIIQNINIQRLDIVVPGAISLPHPNYPDCTEVSIAFLEAIDHNFAITSTCRSGKCTPFTKPDDYCDVEGIGCPLGRFASALTWFLSNTESPYFLSNVDGWYYNARIAAIAWRNAELQRRVNSAVFHLLPFLRVTMNATGGQGRLPPEVMDRIAHFLGKGVLSLDQVTRLREHATDREEPRRVAQALKAGTKEEWLFNGGFWWDKGYEAARAELGYDNTAWPPIQDREAVLQFLAFPPVVSAWPCGRGDEVKEIMRKYERSE